MTTRARALEAMVMCLLLAAAGCGGGADPPPTALAGDAATADGSAGPAPLPPPAAVIGSGSADPAAPAASPPAPPAAQPTPPAGKAVSGARILDALKGYPSRLWPGPHMQPEDTLSLFPDGVPQSGVAASLYAWSQLIRGGQGTVSFMTSQVDGRPVTEVEYLVASGRSAYLANLALGFDGERIVFDEVAMLDADASVPLDVPLFDWRSGDVAVALVPRSVDADPGAFELCWHVRRAALDRRSCSVHGRPYAASVTDTTLGVARRLQSRDGVVPWIAQPPAGTPAPPPVPHPIRYVFGATMVPQLIAPDFGSPSRKVVLEGPDGSGSTATLCSSLVASGQSWFATLTSTIDSSAPVSLAYTAEAAYRYMFSGRIEAVVATTAHGARPLPGIHTVLPSEIYPLDVTLLETTDGVASVRALLQSIDGARLGYRTCWEVRAPGVERLACSVHDVPGSVGLATDVSAGVTRVYR
jgi:hypothetical protein